MDLRLGLLTPMSNLTYRLQKIKCLRVIQECTGTNHVTNDSIRSALKMCNINHTIIR